MFVISLVKHRHSVGFSNILLLRWNKVHREVEDKEQPSYYHNLDHPFDNWVRDNVSLILRKSK